MQTEKKCIRKFFCFFFGCRKEFCLVIIRLIVKCKTFKKGPLTRVYPELCDLLDNVAEVLQRQIIQDPTILDKEVSSLNFRIHFFAHYFFYILFVNCYALIFRINFLRAYYFLLTNFLRTIFLYKLIFCALFFCTLFFDALIFRINFWLINFLRTNFLRTIFCVLIFCWLF